MTSITALQLKKHFDDELLLTDTDGLTSEIKSEDVYEEFFKHKHLFDFSNYPEDSKFFNQDKMKKLEKRFRRKIN